MAPPSPLHRFTLCAGFLLFRATMYDPSRPPSVELKRQTVALENYETELNSLQTQLTQARAEIETIKAVATVSENTKQEAIDQVRSQWQEEVASLQAIMKGDLLLVEHQDVRLHHFVNYRYCCCLGLVL